MEKLSKYINNIPKKNKKDKVGQGSLVTKADDVSYIENRSFRWSKNKSIDPIVVYLIGLFLVFFLICRPYRGIWEFVIFLFFGGGTLIGIIYGYVSPIKHFVANRQTGKLRVPISMKKPAVWVNFDEGFAYEKTAYLDNFYTSLFFQTKPEVKPGAVFSLADWERQDYWSFLVWYMDKNRPLPPGTAFDAYRQQDYERRKAEGFPKPLYPSEIETPEATPEQQAERKKIGGW